MPGHSLCRAQAAHHRETSMTTAEILALSVNATLAIITGLYAAFTFKILKANQRMADEMALQRRDMLRPVISVAADVDEFLVVSLTIKNTGASPATNLRLTLDTDFYAFAEDSEARNIRNNPIFTAPVSAFSPGSQLRFDLAQGFNLGTSENDKVLTPMRFKINAQYEFAGFQYNEDFNIDLHPFMGSTIKRSKMNDELEKIRKILERLASKSA